MNNESDRVNSPPLISKVDEQLKEIQRIREINNSNMIEIHKIRKLEKELEEYEEEIRLKQLQLNRVIDQNNRQKSSLQQKHEVVQKLAKEIEKRDKILELCHNHGNNGEENSEVFLDYSNGHRTFEFRNGQEILFTIKLERLSSVPFFEKTPSETGIETELALHLQEPKFEKELKNDEEAKTAEQKQSNENSPTKELLQYEFEELPIYKEEEEAKEVKVFEEPQEENNEDDNPQHQDILLKQQKILEEYNHYYEFYHAQQQPQLLYQTQSQQYYQTLPQEQQQENLMSCPGEKSNENEIPSSSSSKTSGVLFSTSENVMNIPEICRWNFGSSECPELAENPVALEFWFDPENSHMTKFFIKLHGDEETYAHTNWKENKYFVLIEQLGLNIPTTHFLKYKEMLEKLEKIPEDQRRIWLDVKNFNFMFHLPHSVLPKEILSRVTHFSFGFGTETNDLLDSYVLMKLLLNHLDNLEFCCINNQQLSRKPFGQLKLSRGGRREMKNLKTLIFIHGVWNFPNKFISTILKLSPNLENIFNLPLHRLEEVSRTETGAGSRIVDFRAIKSLYIRRDLYSTKDTGTITFVHHLSFLHGLSQRNQWNFLQELDCRTFFLSCESSSLDICYQWLSQILMMHAQSLKIIKLQPISSNALALSQTLMQNLTTIQFHLRRRFDESLLSFFPLGFYPTLFPKLSTVEIILELKNKKHQEFPPPPAILFWKHFPSTIFFPGVSFNSVTSLKLQGFNIVSCMKSIAELFPNLQILRLQDELKEVCAVLPRCYCYGFWPRLKQLYLNVNADTRYLNLDAAILGTSEQMCSNLRKEDQQVQEEEIQKLASSSICQLKELELLKIVLRPAENPQVGKQLPIITQVGALVLFLCNSQLKVQIAFDESVDAVEKTRIVSSLSPLQSFSSLFLPIL